MGKNWDKFLLLMWKNWKLQYRRPLQTSVEIIAPILFSILLVILRGQVNPEYNPKRFFEAFCPGHLKEFVHLRNTSLRDMNLLYSPSPNLEFDRSMNFLAPFIKIKGFKNVKELEDYASRESMDSILGAVQLDDEFLGKTHLPDHLNLVLRFPAELRRFGGPFMYSSVPESESTEDKEKLSIKLETMSTYITDWKTHVLFPMFMTPGPRDADNNFGARPGYAAEGFLTLQTLMMYVMAFGKMNNTFINPHIFSHAPQILMQRFPHFAWRDDILLLVMISFLGIIMMLSFVYTCINTVKVITVEKEKQLKEAMKIMGLPNWLHWTAWYFKTLSFLFISIICMVILLRVPWYGKYSIFMSSDPTLLFVFLLIYVNAIITFCFAVSVFFSNANTAAAVAGLLWFMAYAPYLFLQRVYEDIGLNTKLFASLGFNTAMAFGFHLVLLSEGIGEGMHWKNFIKPLNPHDGLSLGLIMMMLIIDSLIYLFIALYVEAVFPGDYGTPLPWYFPFTHLYNCWKCSSIITVEAENTNHEKPSLKKPHIKIIKLHKKFGKKTAIERLSLDIYDDEIMVLLGHNGAGKSTTMFILSGVISPTSGTAIICDYDVRKNMKEIRANLGLCPQHNILFDDLTVREHIYFFSKLKGLSKIDTEREIHKFVNLLNLQDKMNKKSSTLSGGMKRKLSVSIALCGNSKIVFLDEPTAGMDPGARRHLWDLLQSQKKGRCVLLTTHYMDEADLLGDRIAILANGELKCCDTSFALKKKYGSGYHLILEKSPKCDPAKVTQFLEKFIPKIEIDTNVAYQLNYLLPKEYVNIFEKMLDSLEHNTLELGIVSYGISMSTMEEVFKKTGYDTKQQSKASLWSGSKILPLINKSECINEVSAKGCNLMLNQFHAMLIKKMYSTIRNWFLHLIQILIPVLFLLVAMLVNRYVITHKYGNLPKLDLTLDSYKDPITLVEMVNSSKYSEFYLEAVKPHRVSFVANITNTMIQLTEEQPEITKRRYLIGASFSRNKNGIPLIKAWFNNDPYHTPPLALGLVLNSVYKRIVGSQCSISFSNYPLPFTGKSKMKKLIMGRTFGFQLAFNVSFSMAFVSSFYILFYVRERVCKSKHLQFSSGVNGWIFWTSAYMCDLATFLITILALIATLTCFQEEGYKTATDLGKILLIFFYFGFAMLPMMYWASYLFDIPATGYTRMTLFSVFTGVSAFVLIQILSTPGLKLEKTANALHWGLLVIPHYSLATGIRDNFVMCQAWKLCNEYVDKCTRNKNMTLKFCWDLACKTVLYSKYCCNLVEDYYQMKEPGIGRNLLYSFLGGFVLFILLNLGEYQIWPNCTSMFRCPRIKLDTQEEDVIEESKIIHSLPHDQLLGTYRVVAKDLTKCYRKFLAVNGLCLGVKQYECFGLLGINGAGKTTTFKMLTGDLTISSGDAWINGFNLKTQLKEVQKVIGYCPQFDALLIDLTAKETLMMFALIRGIPRTQCRAVCEELAQEFDFYQHINKKVRHLSGGNKRKLSTAVALIGNPLVVCLDEPTAGMDPNTKRFLWDALCTLRDQGKCIVFTSHSMEECEALCTRLAIMVNGNFECLGSIQRLKSKFATGYSLSIKIKKPGKLETRNEDDVKKRVKNFVYEHFKSSVLQEEHQELLVYRIYGQLSWSKIFGILERGKIEVEIEDYSVGQASLEQIFLSLSKYQY